MKKLLSLAILFLLLLTNQSISKSLPPGSGTSIPANILILLDRTFSMNHPANVAAGSSRMKEPMAVVQDSTHGHYWVAELDNAGIAAWNDTPNSFAPYGRINSVSSSINDVNTIQCSHQFINIFCVVCIKRSTDNTFS